MSIFGSRKLVTILSVGFMHLLLSFSVYAADSVKLAIVLQRTGVGADENLPAIKAAEMAIEDINASGGLLGRTLELVVIDNLGTPLGSKKAAQTAVESRVIAIIGAFRSSHCLAMAPVANKARIPMITPTATNPSVTAGNSYVFRACFTDEFQGKALAGFARSELHAEKAVVLTNIDEDYCITLSKYFIKNFTAGRGKVLKESTYRGAAVDFTDVLSTVKSLGPDVVFNPGYARDSGLIIQQATNNGIKTIFLGADAWDWDIKKYAGPGLEGAFHSTQWYSDAAFAENRVLKERYKKKYESSAYEDMQIPLTHDSIMLVVTAIKRAGSFKPEALRTALMKTKDFKGATGSITFDRNGDPIGKEVVIMRFEKGRWIYHTSIRPD